MPDPKSSNEDKDEIRNAADRVVIVAARFALDEYLNYLPIFASLIVPSNSVFVWDFIRKTKLTAISQKSWDT